MAQEDKYTQIILEDMKHKIKIIAEGHSLQAQKLDNLKQQVNAIELRLDLAGIHKIIH